MKKIFIAAMCGLLVNFAPVSAEVVPINSGIANNSGIRFCGYALFAQKRLELQGKINRYQLLLKENPNDAKVKHELAKTWHELGRLNLAEEEYNDALAAFNEAVKLEPNNSEFRKDRDDTLAKVKSGAKKTPTPKFTGLG